jgi:diacylglycerol kinase
MKKWFNSFGHAWTGILLFFRTERNARIEMVAACVAVGLSLWLQLSAIEFAIILLCIAVVLSAEAFNSTIERLADIHHPGIHPDIKALKDIAAGAVLIASILSFIIGLLLFVPKLISLFSIAH